MKTTLPYVINEANRLISYGIMSWSGLVMVYGTGATLINFAKDGTTQLQEGSHYTHCAGSLLPLS